MKYFAQTRMFQMHHVTEYPPIKTGDIRGYNLSDIPQFSNPMSTRENCVYKTQFKMRERCEL